MPGGPDITEDEQDDPFGFNEIGGVNEQDEKYPSFISWIKQRTDPLRERYGWLNQKFKPIHDVYHVSNQAFEQWYSRRHLIWRFLISGSVAEIAFLSISLIASLLGENVLPTLPTIPPFVPLVIAALTLFAFTQWIQTKQAIDIWNDAGPSPEHIRWGGLFGGAIIGGSLGSVFGIQAMVLVAALGAVLTEEAERRIDARIRRAAENRAHIEQRINEEIWGEIKQENREVRENRRY